MGIFNQIIMQLSEIAFKYKKKFYVWMFENNLNYLGLNIEKAFNSWSMRLVRQDEFTPESFCDYVISKDPINVFCVPKVVKEISYQEYKTMSIIP